MIPLVLAGLIFGSLKSATSKSVSEGLLLKTRQTFPLTYVSGCESPVNHQHENRKDTGSFQRAHGHQTRETGHAYPV